MIGRLFYLMIVGVLVFTVEGIGQNTWVKTFGGSLKDRGYSIVPTNDGGYVMTGETSSYNGDFIGGNKGNKDILVMKLNTWGDIVWKKTFGGSQEDVGYSIVNTKDGGYVLTGFTESNNGDFNGMNIGYRDIFVMKLNNRLQIVWIKTFGGTNNESGNSITISDDGGIILTGSTNSKDRDFSGIDYGELDIFVFKLNSNGDIVWKRTFGGSQVDVGYSIVNTKDGGYVLTGFTGSNDGDFSRMNKGVSDIFVIKLNSSGDIIWNKTFGGSNEELGFSISSTIDDEYVLTGWTYSNDGDFNVGDKGNVDICVMKLTSNGDIVWKKTFGGGGEDFGYSITSITDVGYVLSGFTSSNDGDFSGMYKGWYDMFVIKLNLSGEIMWKKTFGGKNDDYGNSISSIDGGYVLTGFFNRSEDGTFTGLNKGDDDIFVMKLDSNGNLNNTTSINEFGQSTTTLSVHPNPFSNSTTVSYSVETPTNVRIELLNTLGQTIEVLREDYTDIGTYQLPLNVSTLFSGMYSVRMRSGSMNVVIPVWVVR